MVKLLLRHEKVLSFWIELLAGVNKGQQMDASVFPGSRASQKSRIGTFPLILKKLNPTPVEPPFILGALPVEFKPTTRLAIIRATPTVVREVVVL